MRFPENVRGFGNLAGRDTMTPLDRSLRSEKPARGRLLFIVARLTLMGLLILPAARAEESTIQRLQQRVDGNTPVSSPGTAQANVAAPASPAANAAGPLASGDSIFIDVYRRPELSGVSQVDADGNVNVPYVGPVKVSGSTDREAALHISSALSAILKNPRVTVTRGSGLQNGFQATRSSEMKTQVVPLFNSSAETMCTSLQGMTTQGGRIGADKTSNSLIITDTLATIQNIMAAISQLDQMPSKVTQVRIETKLAEVEQGAMKELGVRWFAKGKEVSGGYMPTRNTNSKVAGTHGNGDIPANEQVTSGSGNGAYGSGRQFVEGGTFDRRLTVPIQVPISGQMFLGVLRGSWDIGAMLDALVGEDKAKLLATPMILAVNHQLSTIKMTDQYPVTEAYQGTGGTSFNVGFLDVGIKMSVTPHVYKDPGGVNYVQLELNPEVSFTNGMSNGIPIRSVRSSNSVANVRDGQTLVIGGILMNDEQSSIQGVPGLSKVPLVGSMFKHKEKSRTQNELMVFVTPTIHDAPETVTMDNMIDLTKDMEKPEGTKTAETGHTAASAASNRRAETRKE